MRLSTLSLLAALCVAATACDRATSPEVRQDADRAAAAAKDVGDKAGVALENAGQKVQEEAQRLEKKAQPTAEDLALTAKVKAKLAADPEVSALAIDVDTDRHVVTLSGTVGSAEERAEAEKLARHTEGVTEVLNRIVAGPATAAPTPSPAR